MTVGVETEAVLGAAPALSLLHVFPSFSQGGQQMRLAALARAFGPDFRHHVVALDGDLSARDAFAGVDATFEPLSLRKSGAISIANLRALGALLRRAAPDVLCTYNFGALEAALANLAGPRLAHVHYEDGFGPDETIDRQKTRRVLARRLALSRCLLVAPSRGLEESALRVWRLPRARVRRIPNGIDVARFAVERRPAMADAPVVVGAVGALRPEKNYARLMRAFAASKAPARLVIYGDGPERGKLEALAGRLGRRIEFRGATAAPEKAYAAFDVFALSSDTEQMPLTVMEAMAAGLPVAATDVGDIAQMLSEENRPYLAPAGDDAALAARLEGLCRAPRERWRVGAANVEKARRDFALDVMAAAHAAVLREAFGESRR